MSYRFKGYDWTELAECWEITVEEERIRAIGAESASFKFKEEIDVTKFINGMKMVFTVSDEEEVLAEKIKRYIHKSLYISEDSFKDRQIRTDLENFLKALIKESERTDYNAPVYRGILEIESDRVFAKWICNNLESLWS